MVFTSGGQHVRSQHGRSPAAGAAHVGWHGLRHLAAQCKMATVLVRDDGAAWTVGQSSSASAGLSNLCLPFCGPTLIRAFIPGAPKGQGRS